jgi:hypothetical protein
MLAAETSGHGRKLAEMADPSKGNRIIMTTVHDAAAKKERIEDPATTKTRGKASATMTKRTTRIQVHVVQRESVVAAKISHRMLRARRGVTPPHHHQAAPMAVVVVVADQHDCEVPSRICHRKRLLMRAPD